MRLKGHCARRLCCSSENDGIVLWRILRIRPCMLTDSMCKFCVYGLYLQLLVLSRNSCLSNKMDMLFKGRWTFAHILTFSPALKAEKDKKNNFRDNLFTLTRICNLFWRKFRRYLQSFTYCIHGKASSYTRKCANV